MIRALLSLVFVFFIGSSLSAQDITGEWNGVLNVQGMHLRLVFHIAKNDTGYSATMDSPDQGARGIPVSSTQFDHPVLKIEIPKAGIKYIGEFKNNAFSGVFHQSGMEIPLNLSRDSIEKQVLRRPQEPVKPYPYYTEEVSFPNKGAHISLAGTLSLPSKEGKFPAVVLISGSGAQNRDEELLGHKPFLVIADYFTKHGIAVLRYDDRGVAKSTGKFSTATSADFATDVESAVEYLQSRSEIDHHQIGLVGHSEGGLIAPMVAARSNSIAFIVLLAGTGVRGDQLLLLQQSAIAKASGASEDEIKKSNQVNSSLFEKVLASQDEAQLKADISMELKELIKLDTSFNVPNGMTEDEFIQSQVDRIVNPWMLYFIKYDPAASLAKVKCPVLVVNGEKDLQVPAKENLAAIETALKKAGNKQVTVIEFPNLNHLFQESKTGLPSEYGTLEETFSPSALEQITNWIVKQVGIKH